MSDTTRRIFSASLIKLMRPVVRIALRNGFSYQAFSELLRWVYVDQARAHFGIPGRKVSNSRIAVISGMTRREVANLVDMEHPTLAETPERYNRAARVLSGWVENEEYHDAEGRPAILPIDEGEPSFGEIVRMYSGNQPTRAVLDELERVGAVARVGSDRVRLIKSYYEPPVGEQEEMKLTILGQAGSALLESIAHNIIDDTESPYFQQEVYERFPANEVEGLRMKLRSELNKIARQTDRSLSKAALSHEELDDDRRVGVGLYFYNRPWIEDDFEPA